MWRELHYWPVGRRFLLLMVAVLAVAVAAVELGAIGYAYGRLGLSRYWVYAALTASVLGSRVNIPVARLPSELEEVDAVVVVWGVPYVVPALVRSDETVVAVNVGGALVPCVLSAYLLRHDHLGWGVVAATAIVTLVARAAARPVAGVGIVVPTLVPPAAAVGSALLFGGHAPAAVAFVAGTVGSLIGADLLHLRDAPRHGAPVLSIGGAGTFDGIFLTGVIAVLFAG
ncbi:MAG TPA: DUF1614 domain-containing protein [Acidimicrobiales bacterium]|nr:DUF1614 domain-containing protein [Acidimicrobiales bacterium]